MRLVELVICGNRRLLAGGTKELHYTPQSPLQLLLGNNGCGKTSLLSEISPFPATPGDYIKGSGYKKAVFEDQGVLYTIISDFRGTATHSFQCGAESPTVGNATVIRTLAIQTLQYTPEIQDVSLGNLLFTDFTPQKRREWLIKLCDVDVSYALKLHKELSTRVRNAQGALKHAESKLTQELGNKLSEDDYTACQQQLEALNRATRNFLEVKNPNVPEYAVLVQRVQDANRELYNLSQELQSIPRYHAGSFDLDTEINECRSRLRQLDFELTQYKEQHEHLEELLHKVQSTDSRPLQELQLEYDTEVEWLRSHPVASLWDEFRTRRDFEHVLDAVNEAIQVVEPLYLKVPKNTDRALFNRAAQIKATEALKSIDSELQRLESTQRGILDELRHLQSHTEVVCPTCTTAFKPGYDAARFTELNHQLELIVHNVQLLQQQRVQHETYLEQFTQWLTAYTECINARRAFPLLGKLFAVIDPNDEALSNEPKSLVGKLRAYITSLTHGVQYYTKKDTVEHLATAIAAKKNTDGIGIDALTERLATLEVKYTMALGLQRSALAEQRRLDTQRNHLRKALELESKLNSVFTTLDTTMASFEAAALNAALDKEVDALQSTLSGVRELLSKNDAVRGIVGHLEASVNELKAELECSQLLLQTLSPTEGLIAEQLNGYLQTFTAQLNWIVDKIWTVPLVVKTPDFEDGELNYLFPMQSSQLDHIVPDISKGSRGQREVINFAFMLLVLDYLGIKDIPLLLDEVGHSFHQTHRDRLFAYIRTLVETKRVTQVFIVSHFASSHGSLTNADTNILDPTGVLVKPTDNLCLVLK